MRWKSQITAIFETEFLRLQLGGKLVKRRCDTKLMKNLEESLPLAKGVLLFRCELMGTNFEAHITVLSNKDTVRMIDKLGEDKLKED